jgi:hypothetical protein
MNNEDAKGFWNQAMVRKMTAPGFIFVHIRAGWCDSSGLRYPENSR